MYTWIVGCLTVGLGVSAIIALQTGFTMASEVLFVATIVFGILNIIGKKEKGVEKDDT